MTTTIDETIEYRGRNVTIKNSAAIKKSIIDDLDRIYAEGQRLGLKFAITYSKAKLCAPIRVGREWSFYGVGTRHNGVVNPCTAGSRYDPLRLGLQMDKVLKRYRGDKRRFADMVYWEWEKSKPEIDTSFWGQKSQKEIDTENIDEIIKDR